MHRFVDALQGLREAVTGSTDHLRDQVTRLRELAPPGHVEVHQASDRALAALDAFDRREAGRGAVDDQVALLLRLAEDVARSRASALPEWVDAAMLAEFLEAQRHGLLQVEALLLRDGPPSEADHAQLARLLHTLKGEASTVGFAGVEEVLHALEDRLGADGLQGIVDLGLAVKDWILAIGPELAAGRAPPEGPRGALLAALHRREPSEAPPPASGPEPRMEVPADAEMIALFGEFQDEALESLAGADEMLVALEGGGVDPETVSALFRVFHTIKGLAGFLDLGTVGALAHASEALLDDAREDPGTLVPARVDLLLRTTGMIRSLVAATRSAIERSAGQAARVEGSDALLAALVGARHAARSHEGEPPAPVPLAPDASPPPAGGDEEPAPTVPGASDVIRETIKVDLQRVDALVETIGELVIVEAMVGGSGDLSTSALRTRQQLAQLSKIVRDLQRQGLALRMVPLRGVFQKMSRLVRDLSRRSGKAIRFELSGQDAEMDRSLAERLGDPLVHMMRNAVDHGIEAAPVRRAAGKPPTATLSLRAFHEGGNIIIELADDGKGLDREAILKRAFERGLLPEGAQPTDREVWDLIFHPGFSTAERVTDLSGRGVGMDVVKKTVEELRGRIQIASERGRGTTFRLVLPLTLAIIDGMLVGVGGRRYVLPTLAILESLEPRQHQLHRFAGGTRLLDVRGDQIPLVDLGALLDVEARASRDPANGFVVIVDGLDGRFGVLVDDLVGQQQVVIKHVDPSVNRDGLFSGAAILADGQVGLILNPASLRPTGVRPSAWLEEARSA